MASTHSTPDSNATTPEAIRAGFKYFVGDGICSQSMNTLTQGAILTGFALQLGASNLVIGLLSAIISSMQLVQIPSIYIVEKFRTRRRICVLASFGSRIFLLVIAIIPFLFGMKFAAVILLLALLLNTGIASISTCSWNSWMHDLIPHEELGSLFSKRIALATAVSIPLSLLTGFMIDDSKTLFPSFTIAVYSLLFFFGFTAGMIGLLSLSHIPETRMTEANVKQGFLRQIFRPFKDTDFRKLIIFLGVWNFAVNLASPFFTVYLLKVLGFEMSTVIIFGVLSSLMNIAFLQLWGGVADRYSNKSVLGLCGPLFVICIFIWPFATMAAFKMLTIPLLVVIYLLVGISTAGTTLAVQNIGLKLAPDGKATSYLAANSFVSSIAAGFSPVLGGVLADTLAGTQITFQGLVFNNWDIVFMLAVVVGVFSIHRLAKVHESGEVKEEVVVKEMVSEVRKGIRNSVTTTGLQRMVEFPYSLMRHVKPGESSTPRKGVEKEKGYKTKLDKEKTG